MTTTQTAGENAPSATPDAAQDDSWFRIAKARPHQVNVCNALHVGERTRVALMGRAKALLGEQHIPPDFVGRDPSGAPLEGHRHAYFLPVDVDRDGLLDHIVVHARYGLSEAARQVLDDFHWLRAPRGARIHLERVEAPAAREARVWRSTTPFVLTRHPKLRGGKPRLDADGTWKHGPRSQLRDALARLGLPEPVLVEPCDGAHTTAHPVPWRAFQLRRSHGRGRRGPGGAHGFVVTFDRPIRGPIAVGYAAHFGLGQLWPECPSPPQSKETRRPR